MKVSDAVRVPGATRSPYTVCFATSLSTWSGLKSPVRQQKLLMYASLMLAELGFRGEDRTLNIAPLYHVDLRQEDEREGFFPPGAEFDRRAIALITGGRSLDLATMDPELVRQAAPEAGNRPFFLLAGVTGRAPGRLLQYHGMKYSVGDATFAFDPVVTGGAVR